MAAFQVSPEAGSDTAGENAKTAKAYYKSIDPDNTKPTFQKWLVNAGFIANESQWHPSGAQDIRTGQPAGVYGDNIINTDSHAIVLNAGDLGFVRNQFIRCKPSCTALNPIIYTYLENYPVNPFSASGNGGSGFPIRTGYPTTAEGVAAIQSAVNRPLGNLPGCDPLKTDTPLGCSIQRIADVAFEWAPPPTNPSSIVRYGQLYAYVFNNDGTETIALPAGSGAVGQSTPNVATGTLDTILAGDPFPPNLDFLGFKQHPGVCFMCHGGDPQKLDSAGAYPQQGKVDGFRLLPLDIRNLLFTSDAGLESTSRANQEADIKKYNLAVLKTVPLLPQNDGQVTRFAHLRDIITGWYTDSGGSPFGRTTQDVDYLPVGWREAKHSGFAPAGSERLYETVVSPSCRSCHLNRALKLDFGTAANFISQKKNILELVLQPLCRTLNPQKGLRPMPLAHLTYQRLWQANNTVEILPYPNSVEEPQLQLFNTAEQLANYFGYSGATGYCLVSK